MGECTIDHSKEDVLNKLHAQQTFLPENLKSDVSSFLNKETTQELLNDIFHLLKKYDLASNNEREDRNKKLAELTKG